MPQTSSLPCRTFWWRRLHTFRCGPVPCARRWHEAGRRQGGALAGSAEWVDNAAWGPCRHGGRHPHCSRYGPQRMALHTLSTLVHALLQPCMPVQTHYQQAAAARLVELQRHHAGKPPAQAAAAARREAAELQAAQEVATRRELESFVDEVRAPLLGLAMPCRRRRIAGLSSPASALAPAPQGVAMGGQGSRRLQRGQCTPAASNGSRSMLANAGRATWQCITGEFASLCRSCPAWPTS